VLGFFFLVLWCCHIGNQLQEDLTMVGYILVMKVKIYLNPFISCLVAQTMCKNKAISLDFWKFLEIFFKQGNAQH